MHANRMAAPMTNLRPSAIEEILGKSKNVLAQATTRIGNSFTPATGSFALSTVFYLLLYAFLVFLVLVLIHFTYTPIFRFIPGGKGIIAIPGSSDDKVYFNDRKKPLPASKVPLEEDSIATYPFSNQFTVSVDLLVRKLPEQSVNNRLILMKASRDIDVQSAPTDPSQSLKDFLKPLTSMIVYLSETNDLNVLFFSGTEKTEYAISPIKNIPLYTPFRLTIVAEERLFTVYLNGKQTFQRLVPTGISASQENQRFFTPPSWSEEPTQTIFLQNLHIWPRAISTTQVQEAVPALATISDFDAPAEAGGGSCF